MHRIMIMPLSFAIVLMIALLPASQCFQYQLSPLITKSTLSLHSLSPSSQGESQSSNVPVTNSEQIKVQSATVMKSFLAVGAVLGALRIPKVEATTYFDTDVYGDKELKIATVNKLKQKLRNAILADPTLAMGFLQLAINDALGYNPNTKNGGADGSILFEMDREENKPLMKVKEAMFQVQKELQRTNTLSFADVCAFAGSEALESVGCGKVTVQIGRFDAKLANEKESIIPWSNLQTDASAISAFEGSGLEARDALILLSALGEVQRVVDDTIHARDGQSDDEDDSFEPEPFVPTTFGARDAIFGAKVGAGDFGTVYLTSLLKNKINSNDSLGRCILAQTNAKSILAKYIGNDIAYRKDVADTFAKLTQIGAAYTTRNS